MKHLLIILSLILLSSLLTSCEKKNGHGTEIYKDGSTYVGEFKDGKYHGQGTYTFSDGRKYVGEFKDGKQNGQGTHTWSDGRKYVGEYRDEERWNGKLFDEEENGIRRFVNGEEEIYYKSPF